MELRANYTLIGAFTLLSFFGIIFFTLWLAKLDKVELVEYSIFFEERVEGLSENSEVHFNGIPVGTVKKLLLDPSNPAIVQARIAVAEGTPVRQDSVARLSAKGVTGLQIISIAGGSADSPLNIPPEDSVGVITYAPSPMVAITSSLPKVLENATELLGSINALFTGDNKRQLEETITNMATITKALANKAESIETILSNAEEASAEFKKVAQSAGTLTNNMERIVTRLEPSLTKFSREGLPELRMLLVESRNFVNVFTRIGQKIESNPRLFFLGEPVQEYRAPNK